MARHLADLDCQVPPGSRAAGVAISRTRWHDNGDNPTLRVPLIPDEDGDLPADLLGVPR